MSAAPPLIQSCPSHTQWLSGATKKLRRNEQLKMGRGAAIEGERVVACDAGNGMDDARRWVEDVDRWSTGEQRAGKAQDMGRYQR